MTTEQRLTTEREKMIRGGDWVSSTDIERIFAELDALRRELDETREVTDEMVERAATAIFESNHPWTWIQATPTEQRGYRNSARVALLAAMERGKDGDK